MRAVVVGGGPVGCAVTGLLAAHGDEPVLVTRSPERRRELLDRGFVQLRGDRTEKVRLRQVETVMEAAREADLVFVCVQAAGHEAVARELAPHLTDRQTILVLSGLAGSLVCARLWGRRGVLLGETTVPPCSARLLDDGAVQVRMRSQLRAAALPARRTPELRAALPSWLTLRPAAHVLDAALHHPNLIVHPIPMLLNYAAIERAGGALSLMNEGMTARTVAAMDAHDAERVAVLRGLGVEALPLDEVYREFGGSPQVYRSPGEPMGIRDHIHWRYLDEDVPFGAVLLASVGRAVGVPTPISDAVIRMASVLRQTDFWARGRTLVRLGLSGLSIPALRARLVEGTT